MGHPKSIALALNQDSSTNSIKIDALGYPRGKESGEVSKVIQRPIGISQEEWLLAIDTAAEYFRMTSGIGRPERDNLEAISELPKKIWNLIFDVPINLDNYKAALALRGILKVGAGLTHEQMLALNYLTDFTQKGDLEIRLRKLKISWAKYQSWMQDPKFKEQLHARAQSILDEAQPAVTMAIVRGAVDGKLDNIKYFHQITGRDPASQTNSDVRAFLSGLIEILQSEITDSEQMRRIAERLQSLSLRTLNH